MNRVIAVCMLVLAAVEVSTALTGSTGLANRPNDTYAAAQNPQPKAMRRLKRSKSFLGIHFDFHAGPDCTEIGRNTTREMVERILDLVRPDYVQTDCKGHPGLSSYPTKVGNRAPGFVGDPLRIWREVTASRGVGLYMHYSGVWDSEAIKQHPDWAAVNSDGNRNPNAISFFGSYAEQLLIPQLRELAGEYGVDGAWVDGECWASVPDFGEAALKAFREATGIQQVPRKPGDPHWFEFLQFNREAFRRYLRRYITEVKRTHPRMEFCSNWAFSDHMPEPVTAPVDWLSGDFSPENSVNSARVSARYLAAQGKPWDLMAWSFARTPGQQGWVQKSAAQLQREAAVVLGMGGGFAAYFTQRRDGSVKLDELPVMAEVAKFCRARQAFSHGAKPIPQVAILYSTADYQRRMNGLFHRDHSSFEGTLRALLENQYSVELLGEHHLKARMGQYPLIVVPECHYLEPGFCRELLAYARKGGNLLLIGPRAAGLFAESLGVRPKGAPHAAPRMVSDGAEAFAVVGETQPVQPEPGTESMGVLRESGQPDTTGSPAASVRSFGRGRIAATYFDFSRCYLQNRPVGARLVLARLVKSLFPKRLVEVTGSADVDVMVNRLKGRLTIHLVNTSGPHADPANGIIPSIAPVGPLEVTVRSGKRIRAITLQPEGRSLPLRHGDGKTAVTVPELAIHSALMVE